MVTLCGGHTFDVLFVLNRYTHDTPRYPMKEGERFTLVLASTLDESGQPSDGTFDASGEPSLADKYE